MKDPLIPSGNSVQVPVTHPDVKETHDVSPKGKKFNRSVSVVKAIPQKGLRARAKNFLPRPLYKFLVSLVSSNNKAQYALGKAISQARQESTRAWQELGNYRALPQTKQSQQRIYELQLNCRKKDFKLDQLQGWGDSPVAQEKQKVIKLLEQCVESPENGAVAEAYEEACKNLKEVEYAQDTLRLRRAKLNREARALTPWIAEARDISIRLSLEENNQLDQQELTDEEQKREEAILKQGREALARLTEIKKELTTIEVDIRQYDNSLIDDERAQEALFHYEKVKKDQRGSR